MKRNFFSHFFAYSLFLLIGSSPSFADNKCTQNIISFFESRPQEVSIAVAHIHEYKLNPNDASRMVSVLAPTTDGFPNSKVLDLANQPMNDPWPKMFVISDGFTTGDFILVDRREGSPLKLELERIVAELSGTSSQGANGNIDSEELIKKLSSSTGSLFSSQNLKPVSQAQGLQQAVHPSLSSEAQNIFSDLSGKVPSLDLFPLGESRKLNHFEAHMSGIVCKMCIHNALLASLILQEAKIPHRLRTGFASFSGPTYSNTGHTIIELADGRYLDPTWNTISTPTAHNVNPEWIKTGSFWWTPNNHFPYLMVE